MDANIWLAYSQSSQDPDLESGLAKPTFERILRLSNNDVKKYGNDIYQSLSYLGSFYLFSKPVNYEKSEDYFKQILQLEPNNKQWQLKAYYSLSFIYSKQKQWKKAKESYEMVLKIKPDDANAKKALNGIDKYIKAEENQ